MSIDKLIRRFQTADRETRLEALLDASRKLPELPPQYRDSSEREQHRVTECQTPVFLWLEGHDGKLRMLAEVPRESPTVRGFVSLLTQALNDQPISAAAALPTDMLHLMGLDETLGMMRSQGLGAIVHRIRRAAGELAQA